MLVSFIALSSQMMANTPKASMASTATSLLLGMISQGSDPTLWNYTWSPIRREFEAFLVVACSLLIVPSPGY